LSSRPRAGERKTESLTDGVEYHRNERTQGRFSRSFYLPQTVRQDGIKAGYRDWILEIHVRLN
jgi:HSP20 family protein